jgi:Ser/Thr protein kinase RdoA (MazF antagonist)
LDRAERTQTVRDAFLDGYQSARPLSKAELSALPAFVLLRQIWILGVAARNLPNITNVDRETIQHWMFDQCMGFVRSWVEKVW